MKAAEPIREAAALSRRRFRGAIRKIAPRHPAVHMDESRRDVWRWQTRKYRVRALVLLAINLLLFAGLGCFTFWLRTGRYAPFALDDYSEIWWAAFSPTREQQVTLIDFLMNPIRVDQVPLMMLIVPLVMASLTGIPILVSMLYGFWFALPFTAIISFVAVVPWLAITVTLCCLLARWRPLQFSFRYATALVALLPLVAYYAMATQDAADVKTLAPVEMAKLYVPWLLALVIVCILMGMVLGIARLVNYRPGAIAPLMAVMFAVPVVLFEVKVGKDELYYRLLESEYGPASRVHFVDHLDASQTLHRIAELRLKEVREQDPEASVAAIYEQLRLVLPFQLASLREFRDELDLVDAATAEAFAQEQYMAVQACRAFRRDFPHSRYLANALYLEGRALDMRVDRDFFRRNLILRHYQSFPSALSRPVWQELLDKFPDSPLASVAGYRLALLDGREGRVDEAVQRLDELIRRSIPGTQAGGPGSGGWSNLLAKRSSAQTLHVMPQAVLSEARRLRELLVNNRDPHQNDAALQRLLNLDSRHEMYRSNLEQFLADIPTLYPLTPLRDNIQLLLVLQEPSRTLRIERLKSLVAEFSRLPNSDALPMARYELGLAYQEDNRPAEAYTMFRQVAGLHPSSPYADEANRRLTEIGSTAPAG